jgi:hypothetical protein
MFKKIVIYSALALVLAVGALATVNTTYAQETEVEDSPAVQVVAQYEAAFENQYAYQYGDGNGELDPILNQTRTRTQMDELQSGECEGEPMQIWQQLHVNQHQAEMRQQRLHLSVGTCNEACVPIRRGVQGQ